MGVCIGDTLTAVNAANRSTAGPVMDSRYRRRELSSPRPWSELRHAESLRLRP